MPAGRPRKPNSLHILEGTARADRGTDVDIVITPEISTEPTLLDLADGLDRVAVFEGLRQVVNQVSGQVQIDELLLSQLTDQYELYGQAKAFVRENGLVDENGKQFAQVRIMNEALNQCHKLMREFGLTPATRGQVKASNQMDDDPLDNLMRGFD